MTVFKQPLETLRRARILFRMVRWLVNWRDVWHPYFAGGALPPLRLRRGLTLHHTPDDGPVLLVFEVFADKCYRRYIDCPTAGVILDIGANIGAFTLDWASSTHKVRIYAYEPNPKTNKTLRFNVNVNGLADWVTIYDEAVGRACGKFKLWTNIPSLIATGYGTITASPEGNAVSVPMIDLNEVVRRAGGSIELLKIDAEGAEADILEGATSLTLGAIRRVVLEYHESLCPNALVRCKRVLDGAGFRCRIRPHKRRESMTGLLYAWRDTIDISDLVDAGTHSIRPIKGAAPKKQEFQVVPSQKNYGICP